MISFFFPLIFFFLYIFWTMDIDLGEIFLVEGVWTNASKYFSKNLFGFNWPISVKDVKTTIEKNCFEKNQKHPSSRQDAWFLVKKKQTLGWNSLIDKRLIRRFKKEKKRFWREFESKIFWTEKLKKWLNYFKSFFFFLIVILYSN